MTISSTRPVIGIFGKRNNGKSSFINAITGQNVAIVSDQPGTTTDPVKKTIELTGIGPAILVDTAGIDDTGELGELRVKKTREITRTIDVAILILTDNTIGDYDFDLVNIFKEYDIPFFFIHGKSDLAPLKSSFSDRIRSEFGTRIIEFSTKDMLNIDEILTAIREKIPGTLYQKSTLVGDLLNYGDLVLLITPIDIEAPEGRMILPQVQVIRDILDNDCVAIVLKEREVDSFLKKTGIRPALAVTDSQVFLKADAMIPKDIPLTGFSVVLARYKGNFEAYLEGTPKISSLKDGDRVLMLESCTHHVTCDDIGRVKIPRWISSFTGKKLEFDVVAGLSEITRDIRDYALVVQCGGCMITRKQLVNRLKPAIDAGIPVTNYGMTIAWVQGIYERAVAPFIKNRKNETDYL